MIKVLLVDDEQGNVESLQAVMEAEAKFPIEFLVATDEVSATQQILENDIDVVVTDLVMTEEHGGLKVLKAAKDKDPLLMVILLTAYERKLDRYRAYELGAFDCVAKNAVGMNAAQEVLVKVKGAAEFRELAKKRIAHEKTKAALSRFFDPGVLHIVENNPDMLEPKSRMVTIGFWDIRGFSALSEALKAYPTLITGFLEEYFDIMATTIFKNRGVLDKFIGDGTMAIFGATEKQTSDEIIKQYTIDALKAALEIRPLFEEIKSKWQAKWGLYTPQHVDIGLGCGIHTGEVLVGRLGTTVIDQFTALGPNVNFSSRLCARAQAGEILISTGTKLRCQQEFDFEGKGNLEDIKNIPGSYPVFNVIRAK